AFACGTPVLSSDASSLPEVAGGAARVINAREPAAMAEAMVDLLADEAALDELRQKGLARARQFSWERVVRQTTDLYHRVAE
ncbi:MAG: glycosyltransferase, partial [Chloroflexi bacterium]|nr:glycosyltransferase [Chloroflexota bacterium]